MPRRIALDFTKLVVVCRYQVQIFLRLEIEAVCSESADDEPNAKNVETLEEVVVIVINRYFQCFS